MPSRRLEMNRILIAAMMGFVMMGCATNVDEPLPQPAPQEPQKDPPAQTLSGDLRTPWDRAEELNSSITENPADNLGPKQVPNIPGR
jgi:hypothetical protein